MRFSPLILHIYTHSHTIALVSIMACIGDVIRYIYVYPPRAVVVETVTLSARALVIPGNGINLSHIWLVCQSYYLIGVCGVRGGTCAWRTDHDRQAKETRSWSGRWVADASNHGAMEYTELYLPRWIIMSGRMAHCNVVADKSTQWATAAAKRERERERDSIAACGI